MILAIFEDLRLQKRGKVVSEPSKMCRKRFGSTWLTFLGLIYILGSADCHLKDDFDDDNYFEIVNYPIYNSEEDEDEEMIRNDDEQDSIQVQKRNPAFTPFVSVGALSNIQRFFENLKENFKNLESTSHDERKDFWGKPNLPTDGETKIYRPPATAAFLHAVRNQKPPYRMKSFVTKSEASGSLGGFSNYSPAFLRAKFGKRY